jgi:hypothetical protein
MCQLGEKFRQGSGRVMAGIVLVVQQGQAVRAGRGCQGEAMKPSLVRAMIQMLVVKTAELVVLIRMIGKPTAQRRRRPDMRGHAVHLAPFPKVPRQPNRLDPETATIAGANIVQKVFHLNHRVLPSTARSLGLMSLDAVGWLQEILDRQSASRHDLPAALAHPSAAPDAM